MSTRNTSSTNPASPSLLSSLRSLVPLRTSVTFEESLRLAELQAARLLKHYDINEGPIPTEIVSELPRVQVVYADLPVSGTSHWNGSTWVITINRTESPARQRFTIMHEFKHILDHGYAHGLYRDEQECERAADFFAGCVLVPRRLLKSAWSGGNQTLPKLARHFDVSGPAISVRLAQTGLRAPSGRCTPRSGSTPKFNGPSQTHREAWT